MRVVDRGEPVNRSDRARQTRTRAVALLAAMIVLLLGRPDTVASVESQQLPDLTPRLPREVGMALTPTPVFPGSPLSELRPPLKLRFDAGANNNGGHSLEMLGVPTAEPLSLEAHQCVAWTAAACTERRPAGALRWHDEHSHWHFDDFSAYELRRLDADGQPDWTAGGSLAVTPKVSFCLEDSERTDGNEGVGTYNSCTGVLQGISAGWADVYESWLPGQELEVEGVPDGNYALVVTVDPAGKIAELDETNNVGWVVVTLSANGTVAHLAGP